MLTPKNKVIVYAQDSFGDENAKTGIGFIRYGLCETVAIVDRALTGKTAKDVVSDLLPVPIFDSIESAKQHRPDADVLLIGIAPSGGRIPPNWVSDIKKAIAVKLNIVNGLHDFLINIPEIKSLSEKEGVYIWDVRRSVENYPIANAKLLDYPMQVILTVGTDAAIGKMTVVIELVKIANNSNALAKFVATGQTGMMISGSGIPIDAIVGDFMAGAIENELLKGVKEGYKIAFVEGQGSILHPGWAGVTLALLHGSLPHKLLLCHKANRKYLKNTKVPIESLKHFIKIYESMCLPIRRAKVVGIALNTYGLDNEESLKAIKQAEDETGLPAADVIKYGGNKLLNACLR